MIFKTLLFSLSLFVSLAYAQTSDLEEKIDALIPSRVNDSTPGLVIGIVKDGKLTFSKGYGLANLSYRIPNDSKMVYNLGSVSKQFLGYAFAMLHTQGVLNLDDPVGNYLENWPQFKHTVTLRHLLTHTSGYREAYTMSDLTGRAVGVDRLTAEECLEVVRRQPQLEFVPGTRHTYNSTTYVILAEILKNITKTPAHEWVETHIFQPLQMKSTQIESHVGEVILNAAESYTINKKGRYTNSKSNRAIFGAADVYASVEDLAKWMSVFRTDKLGGNDLRNTFLTPFILKDGTNPEYALGIRAQAEDGLKVYSHIGGHEDFIAQFSYYPDHDLGIIVISNFGRRGWLSAKKIAQLFLNEQRTKPEPIKPYNIEADKLKQLEGLYLSNNLNGRLSLTLDDTSLRFNGGPELIPTSANTFGIDRWNGSIETKMASDSTHLTVIDGIKEFYFKVKPWYPEAADLTLYQGNYWSDELETRYYLTIANNKLVIKHRWLGTVVLDPISKDIFKSEKDFYVQFIRSEEDNIKGFNINSERTLNVYFELE